MKEGIDSDMGAKHAKWFVTSAKTTGWLRETELVPKTQGIAKSLKEVKFAMGLFKHGKVPPPFPPHVANTWRSLARCSTSSGSRAGTARPGSCSSEHALSRLEFIQETGEDPKDPYGPDSFPAPLPIAEEGAAT